MFYIPGIVLYIFSAYFFAYSHGFEAMLLNLPLAMIYLFTLLAVLTAKQGYKVFFSGLKAAVFPNMPLSKDICGRAAKLFRMLSKTAALTSILALAFAVQYGLAHAFLAPFLGAVLIAAVFEPLVYTLKKRTKSAY